MLLDNKPSFDALSKVFRLMADGVACLDAAGKILWCNPALCLLAGRPEHEIVGRTPSEAWGGRDLNVSARDTRSQWEEAFNQPTGRRVVAGARAIPLAGASGGPEWRAITYRDSTVLTDLRRRLDEAERDRRSFLDFAPVVLWEMDLDGTIRRVAGSGLRAVGVAPDKIIGRNVLELVAADSKLPRDIRRAIEGETVVSTGSYNGLRFETSLTPVRDHRGETLSVLAVTLDATNRGSGPTHESETPPPGASLRLEEGEDGAPRISELEGVFDTAAIGLGFVSTSARWLRLNGRMSRLLGGEPSDFVGQSFYDALHPDSHAPLARRCRDILEGRGPGFVEEKRFLRRDGTLFWGALTVSLSRALDGSPNGFLVTLADIDERKREQALREEFGKVLELVAKGRSTGEVFEDLARALERQCPGCQCAILAREGERFRVGSAPAMPDGFALLANGAEIDEWPDACADAARKRRRILNDDFARAPGRGDSRPLDLLRRYGFQACWAQPVLSSDEEEAIGVVALYSNKARRPSEREAKLMETAAHLAGVALERARGESALRESRQMLRLVLDTIPQAVFWKDREGALRGCNAAFLQAAGLERTEDVVGKTDKELPWTPEEAEFFQACDREVMETGRPKRHIVEPLTRADGKTIWLETNKVPMRGDDGRVIGMLGAFEDISIRRQREEEVRESEERYRQMFARNPAIKLVIDPSDGRILDANPAAEEFYGFPPGELGRKRIGDINTMPPDQIAQRMGEAAAEKRTWFVFPHKIASGEIRMMEVHTGPVTLGGRSCLYSILHDVTERERAREELRRERDKAQMHLDIARAAFVALDAGGRVEMVNRRGCEILERPEAEVIGKQWFRSFLPSRAVEEREAIFRETMAGLREPQEYVEETVLTARGDERLVAWHNAVLRDDRGEPIGMLSSGQDITERRRAQEKLRHMAYHDALTDLPNRAFLMERLRETLAAARQPESEGCFALMFFDIDRFKMINDSHGHAAGDRLLVEIASRLRAGGSERQIVGRLGGDEFTVLLLDLKNREEAAAAADRVLADIARPVTLDDGDEVFVTASAGIAMGGPAYSRPQDILRDADTALYRAKAQGKARHAFFDQDMRERAVYLMQLENDLRRAIQRDEFRLHYQPIVSLETGALSGFEALIRWIHPERGLVGPDDFIPLAEENGTIVAIGRWALLEACRQLRAWRNDLPELASRLLVSVNLSCKQFAQPGMVESIDDALAQSGLEPCLLQLELTESVLMQQPDAMVETLENLKCLGAKISVDDFGTGYSSLGYLHRFPIDTLKIDRSFVANMERDAHIARTIVELARNMGIGVVAEGVETPESVAALRALGCGWAQGFYFSGPLDSTDARTLIESDPRW